MARDSQDNKESLNLTPDYPEQETSGSSSPSDSSFSAQFDPNKVNEWLPSYLAHYYQSIVFPAIKSAVGNAKEEITNVNKEQIVESSKKIEEKVSQELSDLNIEIKNRVDKSVDRVKDDFRQETEKSKIGIIEAIAIFTSLFTFVSINVTIFSKVEYLAEAAWFTLFFLMSQLIILSIFFYYLNIHEFKNHKLFFIWKPLIIPLSLLIVFIICLLLWTYNSNLNRQINIVNKEEKKVDIRNNQNIINLPTQILSE